MNCIICNKSQKKFFEKLISQLGNKVKDCPVFICNFIELNTILSPTISSLSQIIIELSIDWQGKNLQDFYGIEIAKSLRRDYLVKNPIIFISNLRKSYFEKFSDKFGIVNTKGSGFVSFPFSFEELSKELNETSFLTDAELKDIVQSQCNLHKNLEILAHKLAGLLVNQDYNYEKVVEVSDELAKSINFFTPLFNAQLQDFQNLLNSKSSIYELNESLQRFGDALKGKITQDNWKDEFRKMPKCPPKGYSKILIADDEPLPLLISVLQNEFHYEVVEQATCSAEAERLLAKEKPGVVLSDYYFKRYSHDKKTDKNIGSAFMKKALGAEVGTANESKKPIVAVISKVPLDPVEEIWAGVLDCSGPLYATKAEFIHYKIWQEANRRHIFEPEKINGQELTLEMRCRQRLSPYIEGIPNIILQWGFFKETVKETLSSIKEIKCSRQSEDIKIINSIVKTLTPFSKARDFSLNKVLGIFSAIEKDHKKARELPASEVKSEIRDNLHGKIEQFSNVVNGIESAKRIIAEVAQDLIDLSGLSNEGRQLSEVIESFDADAELLPYLTSLESAVNNIVTVLPDVPAKPATYKSKFSDFPKFNIISIEDDKFWTFKVKTAVEKLKKKLDGLIEINYRHFDNTSEALEAFAEISNSDEGNNVKTIAVVDICLPKMRDEKKPQRKNGIELLEKLSKYSANFPKLVFSTKTSLEDILDLGKVGIPNRNFIAKDNDAEDSILQALSAIIEKKEKHSVRVISDIDDDKAPAKIFINSLRIDFSDKLNSTFHALFELTNDVRGEKSHFAPEEIFLRRNSLRGENPDYLPDDFKTKIQDDIYEVREFIFKTFQENNLYIDVKDLIKTIEDEDTEKSYYELNADLPEYDTEDESDEITSYKVLVLQEDEKIRNKIVETLKKIPAVEQVESFARHADEILADYQPEIICISLENIGYYLKIKNTLPNHKNVILVTFDKKEKNQKSLIQQANNFKDIHPTSYLSVADKDWENALITKFDYESRRVFRGEIVALRRTFTEPTVEVLAESDLAKGILRLKVNNNLFSMNNSNVSKILGYLLMNPKKLVSLETLKKNALGDESPVTKDEQKGWTKKIRNKIQTDWLNTDDRELVINILESSSNGLRLNVQLINSKV